MCVCVCLSVCILALVVRHANSIFSAPYSIRHPWPARLYNIFPPYLTNDTTKNKKLLHIKCVFWFCLQLVSQTFPVLRIIQGDILINVHRYSCNVRVILVRFQPNMHFLARFSRNYSNTKFSWKSVQWERSSSKWTGTHHKAKGAFRYSSNAPTKWFKFVKIIMHSTCRPTYTL